MQNPVAHRAFFPISALIFFLSGAAALIYQSLWAKYLGLLLGHAAYAQTVVLVVFMGGLAIGSWLGGRLADRTHRPILMYAAVEGGLAFLGLVFHGLFVALLNGLLFTEGGGMDPGLWKWPLSVLLVLPQTLLLGMTFPLMASMWLRLSAKGVGHTVSWLYFVNSLGAALGVLFGVFVLLPHLGLPGSLLTAGLVNALIAFMAWVLYKRTPDSPHRGSSTEPLQAAADLTPEVWEQRRARLVLWAAALTGAASFVYEIGWIRLLALALGSTTYTFELMLSAFIAGLAFGGLYVRRHAESHSSPLRYAGFVQLAMGLSALFSLAVLSQSFRWVEYFMSAIARSEAGYDLYFFFSSAVAYAAMLPATFCAGMTLPLFTKALIQVCRSERSVGNLYAANTLGSIVGVLLAVHLLLPLLGVDKAIIFAAVVDAGLGLVLLWLTAQKKLGGRPVVALGFATLILAVGLTLTQFRLDPVTLGSGVFRTGSIFEGEGVRAIYHEDGKTATITSLEHSSTEPTGGVSRHRSIVTNGKPDAAIAFEGDTVADEATMTLTAVLPLEVHDNPAMVANIGFGSGMTVDTALMDERIAQLHNVEIEPKMIEGSRKAFGEILPRAFEEPRLTHIIDDAKAYFVSEDLRFDIIMSEPSNPWVSGVSNLFTEEFYRFIVTRLREGGIFLQWLQLYEINTDLVTSVLVGLDQHFNDYVGVLSNRGDLLLLASADGRVPTFSGRSFDNPLMAQRLASVGVKSVSDLQHRIIFSADSLRPWLRTQTIQSNSDYFPLLSLLAPKSRFKNEQAIGLMSLVGNWMTRDLALSARYAQLPKGPVTPYRHLAVTEAAAEIVNFADWLLGRAELIQDSDYLLLAECPEASEALPQTNKA